MSNAKQATAEYSTYTLMLRWNNVWMLQTHDGAIRALENTWKESVPVIDRIVANYGGAAKIS